MPEDFLLLFERSVNSNHSSELPKKEQENLLDKAETLCYSKAMNKTDE